MILRFKYTLLTASLLCMTVTFQGCDTAEQPGIQPGKDTFVFNSYEPFEEKPMEVYTYRPEGEVENMPILFVLHGTLRNADDYRDNWVELAEKHKVLIITPEFSEEDFPGSGGYNLGGMFDENGDPVAEEYWAYSLIEPIFDEVLELTNSDQERYDIFGHSAGAQFAHRFFLFKDNLRTDHVITANAGWYTMPDFETEFPYGLKNTAMDQETLVNRLESRMMIQLGEEDTDPNDQYLRTSQEAMEQGQHRFERGHSFLEQAEEISEQMDVNLQWYIRTVPETGHDNAKMAIDLAEYLYGNE